MISHRIRVLGLVILCIMRSIGSGNGISSVSDGSDEDDKLKQALVLVDLLKNEYIKALKENHELRKKMTSTTLLVEDSTYSFTDDIVSRSQTPRRSITSTAGHIQVPAAAATTPSPFLWRQMIPGDHNNLQDYPIRNAAYPQHFFRRRIPIDYYDYSIPRLFRSPVPSRRQNVPIRRQDASPSTIESLGSPTDELPSSTTNEPPGSGANHTNGSAASKNETTPDDNEAEPSSVPAASTVQNDTLDDEMHSSVVKTTPQLSENAIKESYDQLPPEVKAQLAMEMKTFASTRRLQTAYTQRSTAETIDVSVMQRIKPTLKIHLARSTRLRLPLSENHAFCFTNPKSPLCRTFI